MALNACYTEMLHLGDLYGEYQVQSAKCVCIPSNFLLKIRAPKLSSVFELRGWQSLISRQRCAFLKGHGHQEYEQFQHHDQSLQKLWCSDSSGGFPDGIWGAFLRNNVLDRGHRRTDLGSLAAASAKTLWLRAHRCSETQATQVNSAMLGTDSKGVSESDAPAGECMTNSMLESVRKLY